MMHHSNGHRSALMLLLLLAPGGCGPWGEEADPPHTVIPLPTSIVVSASDTFHLAEGTRIVHDADDEEAARIGRMLAGIIGNSIETRPAVEPWDASDPGEDVGVIRLTREGAGATGAEGYEISATAEGVTVRAAEAAGLFYGVQTLRHLLPPIIEYEGALPSPLWMPAVEIADAPRFEWRGLMLDAARHFIEVEDVKRFIDLASLYKLNRLHLHLSDDQGWRIEIPSRPRLTEVGSVTEVGGGEGGFYTVEEYEEIVRYAAERFMVVVPEIDVPGHTTAALASYAELNCDDEAPEVYTGIGVGFSAVCVGRESTYAFLDDVIRDISARTPGPYFHVGGDEVERLTEEEYAGFIHRVQALVRSHGKEMIGWDEVAFTELAPGSVLQLWRPSWPYPGVERDSAGTAQSLEFEAAILESVEAGARVILSPANRIYLDLKYDSTTALGLTWAGIPNVRDAYDWRVTELFPSLPVDAVLGIEAPLWGETVANVNDLEHMAFPRLAGVAELAWSAESDIDWEAYRRRLGAQSARWTALGVNYRRSPLVPWQVGPPDR
jgi:hexosaminidase